jgi:hypothetical protein
MRRQSSKNRGEALVGPLVQLAGVRRHLLEHAGSHVVPHGSALGGEADPLDELLVAERRVERDETDAPEVPQLPVARHERLAAPGKHPVADPHRELGRLVRLPRPGRAVEDQVQGEVLGGVDLGVLLPGLDVGLLHGLHRGRRFSHRPASAPSARGNEATDYATL